MYIRYIKSYSTRDVQWSYQIVSAYHFNLSVSCLFVMFAINCLYCAVSSTLLLDDPGHRCWSGYLVKCWN